MVRGLPGYGDVLFGARARSTATDVIQPCREAQLAALHADLHRLPSEIPHARLPPQTSSEQDYLKKGAIASAVGAVAVKYGSLALDLPFEPSYGAALALIFGPTVVTCAVFGARALAGGKGAGGGEGLAK